LSNKNESATVPKTFQFLEAFLVVTITAARLAGSEQFAKFEHGTVLD
jgi:hypothetical protein